MADSDSGWKFAQCFGDKGEVEDITEGNCPFDLLDFLTYKPRSNHRCLMNISFSYLLWYSVDVQENFMYSQISAEIACRSFFDFFGTYCDQFLANTLNRSS